LDPGWTNYPKLALYVTHDVTSLIQSGDNAIGVMLGGGWFSQGLYVSVIVVVVVIIVVAFSSILFWQL
jgi:hypothetical protein